MQIDEAELRRRLNSNNNLARESLPEPPKIPSVEIIHPEKTPQTPQVKSQSLRTIAGILAHQAPAPQVARELGLTKNQVISAKHSSVIAPAVKAGVDRVRELALDKLMLSLGLMTEEKLDNASLKDLSIVAANMSRVVEKTSPKESSENIKLVIYAPTLRSEKSYGEIEV